MKCSHCGSETFPDCGCVDALAIEVRAALVAAGNDATMIDQFIDWARAAEYFSDRDNSYGCVEDAVADFDNYVRNRADANFLEGPVCVTCSKRLTDAEVAAPRNDGSHDETCDACDAKAGCPACDHSGWAPACPFCCAPAAAVVVPPSDKPRKFLVAAFDVTDLNEAQIASLWSHVAAQAEASDQDYLPQETNMENYPDVTVEIAEVSL